MKKYYSILFYLILNLTANSQTISPLETTEFCPGVDITFTVVVPGVGPMVTPWTNNPILIQGAYNITTSGGNTTFNFKGRFTDVNISQVFRVKYSNSNGEVTKDFEFKRIKSLFHGSCTPILPNPPSITADRCQIQTFSISYLNVQYKTEFQSPALCFGTITNYQYLLPSGWSIGGNVSNGSNWIGGGNSVNITSDLSNGDGSGIRIRPINTACGSGLVAGQESIIPISRPAPTLSITSSKTTICTGCETFTINGMPSGATVQWSLSNADASISGCSTCQIATICRSTSTNTTIDLTATVSHCSFVYPVTKRISLGTPSFIGTPYFSGTYPTLSTWNSFGGTGAAFVELDQRLGYTSFYWTLHSGTVATWNQYYLTPPGRKLYFDIGSNRPYGTQVSFSLSATNACGTLNETYYFYYTGINGYRMLAYPNPASGNLTIEVQDATGKALVDNMIKEIQLLDKMGTVVFRQQYGNDLKKTTISIGHLKNDVYTLRIFNRKEWTSQQIIIQN